MKRVTALLVLALLAGCNNKIKKYADQIDNMSVYQQMEATGPTVALGRYEVPANAGPNAAETAANAIITAFEVEMAQRLDRVLAPKKLSEITLDSATQAMNNQGPYPVNQESRWQFHFDMVEYGISGGLGSPVVAHVDIDAQVFGPKGKRIWRRYVSCETPLGPDLPMADNISQTAVNIGTLAGMTDADLRQAFDAAAERCGRETVDRLRGTISRAK